MSDNSELALWEPVLPDKIPASASSASEITKYARQLSSRDIRAIVSAFEHEDYEMMAGFVWQKSLAALKKQVAGLGMDFVGEMLGRQDISATSSPLTAISDFEAISLAEDLGMTNSTEALRLRQGLQLVTHFSALDDRESEEEQMNREDAVSILRACVQSILSLPRIEVAVKFAEFRKALETKTFAASDSEIKTLLASPYFFKRTTLSIVLALLKSADGAQLEHATGNLNVLIPVLWNELRKPEKWQTGQAYAEVYAAGKKMAATGLRQALLAVKGFDFVPETLRSDTFSAAAAKLLAAHDALNNFYNEPEPMRILASLGTSIPKPAFPIAMSAVLTVVIGNPWGVSNAAQSDAEALLAGLRKEQWEYYLNECLPSDRRVAENVGYYNKPALRWIALVTRYSLQSLHVQRKKVHELISAATPGNVLGVMAAGKTLAAAIRA